MIQDRSQEPDFDLGLQSLLPVGAIPEMAAPTLVPGPDGGGGGWTVRHQRRWNPFWTWTPGARVGSSVFLLWTPGTCGEPMLADGHLFSFFVGWLVGRCQK